MSETVNAVPTNTLGTDSITREQLLEALDTEIENVTAIQSATGWNHWVILGALAALLWLGIDTWENGHFILHNVLLLTMAITIFWRQLKMSAALFDSSPLPASKISNRFWSLSGLLGSTRTHILFTLVINVFFLSIVWMLKSPWVLVLKIYFIYEVLTDIIALGISLWDDFPEISTDHKPLPESFLRCIVLFTIALKYIMCLLIWGVVWFYAPDLTTHDLRLALLTSALLFLMSLAVETRIPTNYLQAYRAIRQNVAFGRIPLTEAKMQADMLLIGGNLDQTLQPHYQKFMAKIEKMRPAYYEEHQLSVELSKSIDELVCLPIDHASIQAAVIKIKAIQKKVTEKTNRVQLLSNEARKQFYKFKARYDYLKTKSPESCETLCNLMDQMNHKIKEITVSIQETSELAKTANTTLNKWLSENKPHLQISEPSELT